MRRRKIEYGELVEAALRTVVRDVLKNLANGEVQPPHHFYVTFKTGFPGVELPDHLRQRYPGEMTIVLQHQYWDLQVEDERFSVMLSFNDTPSLIVVPFNAIKVFADPGAEFGLQFTHTPGDDEAEPTGEGDGTVSRLPAGRPAARPRPKPVEPALGEAPEPRRLPGPATLPAALSASRGEGSDDAGEGDASDAEAGHSSGGDDADAPEKSAEIVTLDRFRKK